MSNLNVGLGLGLDMKSNVFLHPASCRSPALIELIQRQTDTIAVLNDEGDVVLVDAMIYFSDIWLEKAEG